MHLSFGPYVPTPLSPYAGHQFYFSLLSELAASREVVVVAPRTEDNEAACAGRDLPFEFRLTGHRPVSPSAAARLRRAAGLRRLGESLPLPVVDDEVDRLCGRASSFALHWSQTLALAGSLEAYRRPMLAVEYDLVWTTIVRAAGALGLVSPRAPISRRLTRGAEVGALNRCDLTVVFKEADVATLRSHGYTGRALVASPTLQEPGGELVRHDPPNILFVAAFDRRENYEGAAWFISDVLPRLRSGGVPFTVTFAGAGMRADLADLASRHGVATTGFVPDLDPIYRAAAIVIAPIHRLGGLRFKVPQAMKYGLPVVATTEALRGLDDAPAGTLAPPCDGPEEFADTILVLLGDEQSRTARGRAAQAWVDTYFSAGRTFGEISRWMESAEDRGAPKV